MNHKRLPAGRRTTPLVAAAVAGLLLCTKSVVGEDKLGPGKSFIIQTSIRETHPKNPNNTRRILADPKVVVKENTETEFLTDGRIQLGAEDSPSMVSLKVTARSTAGNKIFVSGVMEVSAAATPTSDIMVRESTSVHFAKIVAAGERVSFHLSESKQRARWFELQVVEANSKPVPQLARAPMPSRQIR
jgi:hypothetical protein